MSSFTDNPELLTRFTPYREQLPTQALVAVGMEKQRRYDEGLEKIQSSIDRVAGLDIIRDVDKQYLESKLSDLGDNLKIVAGGDFSETQLVNSVAGMAGRIGKDPNIINAVSSTRAYRNGVTEMQSAIKEGKSSPSNEWLFKSSASKWLSSDDINEQFSDSYTPYTDVKKHALEVIKALTKSSTITEDAFTVDSKGNIVIADAMVKKQLAGISPEQIQQALLVGLSPADMKQLEIDGRYSYSNLSPEGFKNRLEQDRTSQKSVYSQKRKALEDKKAITKSANEISIIDDKIAELDKTISKVDRDYNSLIALDPESAKATLHTHNFMNNFGSAFSYTETSETLETSPLAEMQKWRDEMKFKKESFEANYKISLANLEIAKENLAIAKDKAKGGGGAGWGGLEFSVDGKYVPEVAIEKVLATVKATEDKLMSEESSFLKEQGISKEALMGAERKWLEDPSSVNADVDEYFRNRQILQRNIDTNNNLILKVQAIGKEKVKDVEKKIATDPPLTVNVGGTPVTYTAREIADFSSRFDKYKKEETALTPHAVDLYSYNDEKAQDELSDKDYILYEILKKGEVRKGLTSDEKGIVDRSNLYKSTYGVAYSERNKVIADELKNRLTSHQGVSYTINSAKPEDKQELQGILKKVYNLAQGTKGLPHSPDLNKDVLEKLIIEPEIATIKVVEGTEFTEPIYEVSVSGKAGQSTFRLSQSDKTGIWGNRFELNEGEQSIRPYQEQMRKVGGQVGSKFGGTTTATDGQPTNVKNAYLNGRLDFQGVKMFGLSGNLTYNERVDGYLFKLNIKDPIKDKWVENISYPSRYMTAEEVNEFKTKLNDSETYRILYDTDSPATNEELENLKKYRKNSSNGK